MNIFVAAAAVLLAALCLETAPALAQRPPGMLPPVWDPQHSDLQNPQIDIAYVEPKNPDFRPIYDKLKKRFVLEELKAFLAPLRLPGKLPVKVDQCGAQMAPDTAEPSATICYEYVARIEDYVPLDPHIVVGPGKLQRDDLLVGPFVMVALHELAQAAFILLKVPVWGNMTDAADRVAGFILTQFGKDVAWTSLMGAAWYLSQSGATGLSADFSAVRNLDVRRFYNYLCMAYASDPKTYQFLVRDVALQGDMIGICERDYQQVQIGFRQTILPHIDQDLLRKVQATRWLPSGGPQR
jgi:hypothetical protein